jgi:hypothetical protein
MMVKLAAVKVSYLLTENQYVAETPILFDTFTIKPGNEPAPHVHEREDAQSLSYWVRRKGNHRLGRRRGISHSKLPRLNGGGLVD